MVKPLAESWFTSRVLKSSEKIPICASINKILSLSIWVDLSIGGKGLKIGTHSTMVVYTIINTRLNLSIESPDMGKPVGPSRAATTRTRMVLLVFLL